MESEGVCTVRHDPEVPCVVMIWKGYATSAEFRSANVEGARIASARLGQRNAGA
jgi:hypothetical protein